MLIYEIGSVASFIVALIWVLRSRNPVNMGALIGGMMLFGFDWFWCIRSFWNATFNADLAMIPGLAILGERYPIAVVCNWAVGFGIGPLLLSKIYDSLRERLGKWHVPVIFLGCAVTEMLMEIFLVHLLGVYSYHQAPAYLFFSVPWSNTWFLGGVIALSYFGLAHAQRWSDLPDPAGCAGANGTGWKGLVLAPALMWAGAFGLTMLQLYWYSATTPWVESGRLF